MKTVVAKNLLETVCIIEGMMAEINAKTVLLKERVAKERRSVKNEIAIKVLESEVSNLIILLELIDGIYDELKKVA